MQYFPEQNTFQACDRKAVPPAHLQRHLEQGDALGSWWILEIFEDHDVAHKITL